MNPTPELFLEPSPYFVFTSPSSKKPVRLDLVLQKRKDAGSKNDLLYKALGRQKDSGKTILDVTGGLLRDSVHMAQLGYKVTALERHPLLFQGMHRALDLDPSVNVELIEAEAIKYLQSCEVEYDIIYVDPMFPEAAGSALAGKEAQLLKQLAGYGNETDNKALLELAIKKAKSRVVFKRPRKSDVLVEKPTYQVLGQSTRYDVY